MGRGLGGLAGLAGGGRCGGRGRRGAEHGPVGRAECRPRPFTADGEEHPVVGGLDATVGSRHGDAHDDLGGTRRLGPHGHREPLHPCRGEVASRGRDRCRDPASLGTGPGRALGEVHEGEGLGELDRHLRIRPLHCGPDRVRQGRGLTLTRRAGQGRGDGDAPVPLVVLGQVRVAQVTSLGCAWWHFGW
jgi:hypothetical protein